MFPKFHILRRKYSKTHYVSIQNNSNGYNCGTLKKIIKKIILKDSFSKSALTFIITYVRKLQTHMLPSEISYSVKFVFINILILKFPTLQLSNQIKKYYLSWNCAYKAEKKSVESHRKLQLSKLLLKSKIQGKQNK